MSARPVLCLSRQNDERREARTSRLRITLTAQRFHCGLIPASAMIFL